MCSFLNLHSYCTFYEIMKTSLLLLLFLTDGFVSVDELLAHPQFRSYSLEDIKRVVATNDKQRFKLYPNPENGLLQIRANQGHSVLV